MRSAVIPLGSWPRQMSADLAAGYCRKPEACGGAIILYRVWAPLRRES
jgi:hypothetical protein